MYMYMYTYTIHVSYCTDYAFFGFVSVSCLSCFNMDHRSLRRSGPENLLCLDSVAELA